MFMTARARRPIVLLVLAAFTCGCTGYRHVALGARPPDGRSSHKQRRAGETVRVELRDGTQQTITIKAVDAEALIGARGERVVRAQVVAVRRPAPSLSPLRRLAILGLVILVQVIVFATYEG